MQFRHRLLATLFSAALLLPGRSFTQSPTPIPPVPQDTNTPIDGGLSLLIAAGLGYAAKRKYDQRKREAAAQRDKNGGEAN